MILSEFSMFDLAGRYCLQSLCRKKIHAVDKKKLIQIVDRFANLRIVVWGDLILDEHLYGTTRRISREAPVLILDYRSQEYSLGGAGNSLQNLRSLGAFPIPVGVIGRDEAGKKILSILRSKS